MKLKQRNLLLFLGGSAGAMSAKACLWRNYSPRVASKLTGVKLRWCCDAKSRPQATDRQSLRAGIALDFGEAITSSALIPHTLPFLCRSQISLLFVLAGSFQGVTLMPMQTADLTLKQIEYRTHEAVADLVPPDFTYRGQIR